MRQYFMVPWVTLDIQNTSSVLCHANLNHTVPTEENKAIVNIGNRKGSFVFSFLS